MKLIKEDITDFLKPKSKEDILNNLPHKDTIFKPSKKSVNGTYRIGIINDSLEHLMSLFGNPRYEGIDASHFEWVLEDLNGNVYTIYDYSSRYLSLRQLKNLSTFEWHIGGDHNSRVNDLIAFILKN